MPLKMIEIITRPNTSIGWWVKSPGLTTRAEEGLPPWLDSSFEISSDGLTRTEILIGEENWEHPVRKTLDAKVAYYTENNFIVEKTYEHIDELGNVIKSYETFKEFRADNPIK